MVADCFLWSWPYLLGPADCSNEGLAKTQRNFPALYFALSDLF